MQKEISFTFKVSVSEPNLLEISFTFPKAEAKGLVYLSSKDRSRNFQADESNAFLKPTEREFRASAGKFGRFNRTILWEILRYVIRYVAV